MTLPTVVFPPDPVTPLGAARALSGHVPEISFVGADGTVFYLQGAMAPDLLTQTGIGLISIDNFQASFNLLDEQAARQDGITNLDTVFEPAYITMTLEAGAPTPAQLRQVIRTWISSWNPPNVGTLSVFTQELGEWWMSVRQAEAMPGRVDSANQDPSLHRRYRFNWKARGDNAFWYGVDSVSQFPGGSYPGATQSLDGGSTTGWCPLTNFGTQLAFPRFLCYGPGTFILGNGGSVTATGQPGYASGYAPGVVSTAVNPIQFGPLNEGQIALITTLPRLRSVVDLSPGQAPQTLTKLQSLIETLVNLVTNSNVPPLLEKFESLFGILPPQGPMYSLLQGRFTTSSAVPPMADGYTAPTSWIPVGITGGNSNSKIVAALTPMRTWPW